MDRFLIGPPQTGLQTNVKPFLVADDAFTYLQNAYVYRDRLRKRFGSQFMVGGMGQLLSRLRVQIGTSDMGTGNFSITPVVKGGIYNVGQLFSIGTTIFTVPALGTPVTLLTTGAATGTLNTTTGALTIVGNNTNPNTAVYYYPSNPVMGLPQYEAGSINNHPTYGFDPQFAYLFTAGTGWSRSFTTNVGGYNIPVFHDPNGTQNNYFWSANWMGVTDDNVAMYNSNFQVALGTPALTDDPIWVYNGSWQPFSYSSDVNQNNILPYANQQPYTVTNATAVTGAVIENFIQSALIIVPFKDRLVMLNTIENNANGATQYDQANPLTTGITPTSYTANGSVNTQYKNRARWSKGFGSPFDPDAWLEVNNVYQPFINTGTGVNAPLYYAVGGGVADAYTDEAIVGAEFIKDHLIVYFERSTWELAFTGNEANPFVWNKLNTELGSQGTFSTVPFDKEILAIGQSGIHSCNGSNVRRIDDKIPNQVFKFTIKNNFTNRIAGIRDYYTELVYWTVPISLTPNQNFTNQLLVYNYKNGSWALFDDCFTTFGYFEQQSDVTWASSAPATWQQYTSTWRSGLLPAQQRQILCGTPEGFVVQINQELARNAPTMQITNITTPPSITPTLTIINHNFSTGDYVLLENIVGTTELNNQIFQVTVPASSPNAITINFPAGIVNPYLGGGTATRVSNIEIQSKQWNPYMSQDRNFHLYKIDFFVFKTQNGAITVDYSPSSSDESMLEDGAASGAIVGTGVLETFPYNPIYAPLEQYQERLNHPIYFQASGTSIQLYMYMTYDQMTNYNLALSWFEIQSMILYCQPTDTRLA
jgi:hypothetical protein